MPLKSVSVKVDDSQAGRVDVVVQKAVGVSRGQVRGLIDHGCVTVNRRACSTCAHTVASGDLVEVTYDTHRRYHEKKTSWSDRTFHVVFEDDDLIVVDKAAGVLTVPTDWNEKNTLVDRLSLISAIRRRSVKLGWFTGWIAKSAVCWCLVKPRQSPKR